MKRNPGTSLACALVIGALAFPAFSAAPAAAPAAPRDEDAKYQYLKDAADAVVGVQVKALANARNANTLGVERAGSGVLIEKDGLVLTIGYLILEADQVDVVTKHGRTVGRDRSADDRCVWKQS